MTLADAIPSLNDDPAFIAIGRRFEEVQDRRRRILVEAYGAQGHVSLGGNVRPELGLCNISRQEMFDGKEPEIGDVVILGYLYGDDSAEVVVGRLAEHYDDYAAQPMPDLPGYRFAWRVDPITAYGFAAEGRGHDYHRRQGKPDGEMPVDQLQ